MGRCGLVKYVVCVVTAVLLFSIDGKAQRMAVSTDALQWAIISPNVSLDVVASQHHAFSLSASMCPVEVSKRLSVTHLSVTPEYKYWFRMPFYGHYAGADLLYSSYEIDGTRYQRSGNLIAACATYGYSMIINKRLNLVPHVAAGIGVDMGESAEFIPIVAKIGVNIQIVVK